MKKSRALRGFFYEWSSKKNSRMNVHAAVRSRALSAD
jgi:hypothetical protein